VAKRLPEASDQRPVRLRPRVSRGRLQETGGHPDRHWRLRGARAQRHRHRQGSREGELPRYPEYQRPQEERLHAVELPAGAGQVQAAATRVLLCPAEDLPGDAAAARLPGGSFQAPAD